MKSFCWKSIEITRMDSLWKIFILCLCLKENFAQYQVKFNLLIQFFWKLISPINYNVKIYYKLQCQRLFLFVTEIKNLYLWSKLLQITETIVGDEEKIRGLERKFLILIFFIIFNFFEFSNFLLFSMFSNFFEFFRKKLEKNWKNSKNRLKKSKNVLIFYNFYYILS